MTIYYCGIGWCYAAETANCKNDCVDTKKGYDDLKAKEFDFTNSKMQICILLTPLRNTQISVG